MNDKAPEAFRTISEVAEILDIPQHVLRFWETRFSQIKPMKRGGGRRYYRPDDVLLLRGIRHLLYGEGYTIKGVQRILKENGIRHVIEYWENHEAGDAAAPAAPEPVAPVEAPPQPAPAAPVTQTAPVPPANPAPQPVTPSSQTAVSQAKLSPQATKKLQSALQLLTEGRELLQRARGGAA